MVSQKHVRNALLQNMSIAHLCFITKFAITHPFLCHLSNPFFGAARRLQHKTEQDYRVINGMHDQFVDAAAIGGGSDDGARQQWTMEVVEAAASLKVRGSTMVTRCRSGRIFIHISSYSIP
jgi:hypothetical protein